MAPVAADGEVDVGARVGVDVGADVGVDVVPFVLLPPQATNWWRGSTRRHLRVTRMDGPSRSSAT